MTSDKQALIQNITLTDVELELMQILWDIGDGGVRDVMGQLPTDRPLAYTSVSTILRILEKKGVLKAEKEGRGHRYCPLISREEYQSSSIAKVIDQVFQGQPTSLMRALVDGSKLSESELTQLRDLIEETLS